MAGITDEQAVRIRIMPRRVMVRCPSTAAAVDTGYGPKAAATQRGAQVLANCPECRRDHTWRVEDAFLGP